MNREHLGQLFPTLEEPLFEELVKHGTIKEVQTGDTLLRAGQTIRTMMLILDGMVKLYRENDARYPLQSGYKSFRKKTILLIDGKRSNMFKAEVTFPYGHI